MEPHDAVPGRAMDALDSCLRRRDQGVCIYFFGCFPPTSEVLGGMSQGQDALDSLFESGILEALESSFCRQLTLRSREEVPR
jgi:hypothetical protein